MRLNSAGLLALASAITAQNVVQFELTRSTSDMDFDSLPSSLDRRDTFTASLANNITGGGYFVTVTVGGQNMTMILDTGSSDAWVLSHEADICTNTKLQDYYDDTCAATYNPSLSNTSKVLLPKGFSITYLDGGGAKGDYISEDMTIGGVTVKGLQMGYATTSSRGTGILGVGFAANEAARQIYPNLIDELVIQGHINSLAYSLYLDDRRKPTGNILFGGVDTKKFIGPLSVLPVLKADEEANHTAFLIAMNGLAIDFANGSSAQVNVPEPNLPAILDSGTTLSYLPDSMAIPLFQSLGAYTESKHTGLTFVDCKYLNAGENFNMHFIFGNNISLAVPVEEMVMEVFKGGSSSTLAKIIPLDSPCLFGIQSGGDLSKKRSEQYRRQLAKTGVALLGDTFLRSAYVVYDLTNAQIGIAPANLNSTETNIKELKGGVSELGSLTGVASQQTPSATPSATSSNGGGGGGSSSSTTTTAATTSGSGSEPTGSSSTGPKNNSAPMGMKIPAWELFGVAAAWSAIALLADFLPVL